MYKQRSVESTRNNSLVYIYLATHPSIGAKRTIGVYEASHEYIVMWDDDDVLPPRTLQERIAPLVRGDADVRNLRCNPRCNVRARNAP